MSRTPGPWKIFGVENHVMGITWEDAQMRRCNHAQWTHNCSKEDAERIVLCVNALEGLDNETLAKGSKIAEVLHKIKSERDELVAAYKHLRHMQATKPMSSASEDFDLIKAQDRMNAAVHAVEVSE